MKIGFSRRAAIVALAGLLLAGNLAFYLWYRATAQERKNGMEARRVQLTRDVEAREKEATVLAHQRARLTEVSAAVEEFYGKRIGRSRETLAPVVLEIHNLLQRAGLAPAGITYATKAMRDLPLSEMIVTFAFRTDYTRLKQFLASVESDRKWIVVREIGLSRDTEIPGSVQVRVTMGTYFASEEATVPSAAARPAASTVGVRR